MEGIAETPPSTLRLPAIPTQQAATAGRALRPPPKEAGDKFRTSARRLFEAQTYVVGGGGLSAGGRKPQSLQHIPVPPIQSAVASANNNTIFSKRKSSSEYFGNLPTVGSEGSLLPSSRFNSTTALNTSDTERGAPTPFGFADQMAAVTTSFESASGVSAKGGSGGASSGIKRKSRSLSCISGIANAKSPPSSFSKAPSAKSMVRSMTACLARRNSQVSAARDQSTAAPQSDASSPSPINTDGEEGSPLASLTAVVSNAMNGFGHLVSCACLRFAELAEGSEDRPTAFTPHSSSRRAISKKAAGDSMRSANSSISSFTGRISGRPQPPGTPPTESLPESAAQQRFQKQGESPQSINLPVPQNDVTNAQANKNTPPRIDLLMPPPDLDDLGKGEEATRRYKEWSSLARNTFPGAAGGRAIINGEILDNAVDLEASALARAQRWIELNGIQLVQGYVGPMLTPTVSQLGPATGRSTPEVTSEASAAPEAIRRVPKDMQVLFTAWRHRRSGALYQRGLHAVATALKQLLLPGVLFSTPLTVSFCLAGSLITATWLPPMTSRYPLRLVAGSHVSQVSRSLSAILLGSFFASVGKTPLAGTDVDEDHVPAVDFYPCADGSYALLPSLHLLDALSMQRCEQLLHDEAYERLRQRNTAHDTCTTQVSPATSFASTSFSHSAALPTTAAVRTKSPLSTPTAAEGIGSACHTYAAVSSMEELRLGRVVDFLVQISPLIAQALNSNPGTSLASPTGDSSVLLRDIFHSNGLQMRELLRVRSRFDRTGKANAVSADHLQMITVVSSMMLSEAIARTLKAMMLSRAAMQLAGLQLVSNGTLTPAAVAAASLFGSFNGGASMGLGGSVNSFLSPFTGPSSVPAVLAAVLDAVNLVFKKFLSSSKFHRDSLVPALVKRFPCDVEFAFEAKQFRIPDIVKFLQHRLGLHFSSERKEFTLDGLNPAVGVDEADRVPMPLTQLCSSYRAGRGEGVLTTSITADSCVNYIQYLSGLCSEAEAARKRAAQANSNTTVTSGTQKLAAGPEAVSGDDTITPLVSLLPAVKRPCLLPTDLAILMHLHQLNFTSQRILRNNRNAPMSDSEATAALTSLAKGFGPSVVRLTERIMRQFQLPVNFLASCHHLVDGHPASTSAQRMNDKSSLGRPPSPSAPSITDSDYGGSRRAPTVLVDQPKQLISIMALELSTALLLFNTQRRIDWLLLLESDLITSLAAEAAAAPAQTRRLSNFASVSWSFSVPQHSSSSSDELAAAKAKPSGEQPPKRTLPSHTPW